MSEENDTQKSDSEAVAQQQACSDGIAPQPFQPIETAPKDGTEVVGWVPRQGHVLMIWKDKCWQSAQRTKTDRNGLFQHAMQLLANQPTQWRPKQDRCTEWRW